MTKKLLALLLTIFMVLAVFAGCNSDTDANSEAVNGTDSTVVDDNKDDGTDKTDSSVPGGAGESDADATDSSVPGGAGEIASNTGSSKTNNTASSTSSSTSSTEKPATLRGTTVKFATWIDINKTEYGPVIQAFTKATGIRVKIVNVPQHEYITKLTGLIASGNSPDVINDNSEFPRTIGITQPITVSGINPNDSIWNPIITHGLNKTYFAEPFSKKSF